MKTGIIALRYARHINNASSSKNASLKGSEKLTLKIFLTLAFLLFTSCFYVGATTRTASVNGNWNDTATWGGEAVPTATDDVIINFGITVSVNTDAVCASLTFGNSLDVPCILNILGNNSLTINGNIIFVNPVGNRNDQTINVDAGTLNCANINYVDTDRGGEKLKIYVTTGTVNVTGDITFNGAVASNVFSITNSGTLNIAGSITGNGKFQPTGTGCTVNFNGSGAQTIPVPQSGSYYHLTTSVGGVKTTSGSIVVNGNLTVNNPTTFNPLATDSISGTGTLTGTGIVKVTRIAAIADFIRQYPIANKTLANLTVDYIGAGAQTVNALNYGNLTISQNGTRTVTLANASTIGISGVFNPTNLTTTYIIAGSTVDFNGIGVQSIPAFNYNNLTISGARASNNVTLASSGTIGVAGIFAPTATFSNGNYINTGSTIDFNGGIQNIPSFNFYNLACSGSTTKTVIAAASVSNLLTVSSAITLAAGNDLLTLLSTATQTANVGAIPANASITGQVIAQRFVSGGNYNPYRCFRMLSLPVYDNTTTFLTSGIRTYTGAQLIDDIFVTGPSGGIGFDALTNSQASVFTYNEPAKTAAGLDYVSIPNISTPINVGQGLMVFYRGDRSNSAVLTNATINPNNTIMTFKGILNQQMITQTLSYTDNGEGVDGFNLLGNPYQCTIDWNAAGWTKTNISNTIYVYNPSNRTYSTFDGTTGVNNGSRYIHPGQAFFVKATGSEASVTFTEDIKAPTTQQSGSAPLLLSAPVFAQDRTLKLVQAASTKKEVMEAPSSGNTVMAAPISLIRARLENGNFYDETVIVFKDGASNNFTLEDAPRLEGGSSVALASQSADQKVLAINYMGGIEQVSSVKLYVSATASGTYGLKFTNITLPLAYRVQLKDNYLNTITDINASSLYTLSLDKSVVSSFGNNRFEILISNPVTLSVNLISFTGKAAPDGALLNWQTKSENNNDRFDIERSLDGQAFIKIGSVKSVDGNSTKQNSYKFLDTKPASGLNYYRLKQVDLDGKTTIINPIAVTFNSLVSNDLKLKLYPNPTTDKINISFNANEIKDGVISIYDTNGKKQVNKHIGAVVPGSQIGIDVLGLSPGVYFVEIRDNNNIVKLQNSKFVKQ